ncbi:hypothetical protein [Tranquillimonas rosea]|uniref:hypothetical protein n=1 Tax=Tranquillimonas rosea TaxID=641238 RepID=UPI003BADB09E
MQTRHPLIAFYIRSCLLGFALAAVFTGGVLWLDVGHLRHLVTNVDGGFLALFLLWAFNGIVFSGAQATVSVLLMAEDTPADRGPRGGTTVPIPVRVDGRPTSRRA